MFWRKKRVAGLEDRVEQLEKLVELLNIQLMTDVDSGYFLHPFDRPTLRGKVNAIAKHLGIEFDTTPSKSMGVKVVKNKEKK